jgi:hypothetical protein
MEQIGGAFASQPIIIGAELAGLLTARYLAPEPVIVLAKAPTASGVASAWVQGGIAAAVGAGDAPALYAADSLTAGAGLCDVSMVEQSLPLSPALSDMDDCDGRAVAGGKTRQPLSQGFRRPCILNPPAQACCVRVAAPSCRPIPLPLLLERERCLYRHCPP